MWQALRCWTAEPKMHGKCIDFSFVTNGMTWTHSQCSLLMAIRPCSVDILGVATVCNMTMFFLSRRVPVRSQRPEAHGFIFVKYEVCMYINELPTLQDGEIETRTRAWNPPRNIQGPRPCRRDSDISGCRVWSSRVLAQTASEAAAAQWCHVRGRIVERRGSVAMQSAKLYRQEVQRGLRCSSPAAIAQWRLRVVWKTPATETVVRYVWYGILGFNVPLDTV